MRRRLTSGAGVAAVALGVSMASACGGSASPATPSVRATAPEPAASPAPPATPAGTLIPVGHEPEGLVADAQTGLLAVAVRGPAAPGDGVELVALGSNTVQAFVPTRGAARHLQLAATGGPVLVPAEQADTLDEVSLASNGIQAQTAVGRQPHDATALAGHVLVTDELADEVTVVSGGSAVATVRVPVQPGGIAGGTQVDGRTPVALVVGVRGRQVEALDPAGGAVGRRAAAGVGPTHVRFAGGRFYVADTSGGAVLVYTVDGRGPHQVGRFATGATAPYGLAVDPERHRLWVTLTATDTLLELGVRGDALVEVHRYPTARQPNDVAVDPTTGAVVVAATGADELEVITPTA